MAVDDFWNSVLRVEGLWNSPLRVEILRILATTPSEQLARMAELEPERVRLLPAGLLILEEIADRLGRRLHVGRGGLREGVIVDLLIAAGWGAAH